MARRARLLAATALGFASALTVAQPLPASAQQGMLEEIVVVARKREESLQDTPISVTAFTGRELDNRGLGGVAALDGFVPNLNFTAGTSGSPSAAQLFIRGIGQQDFLITADPGVGVYVDGIYIPRAVGMAFDFFDLERVEVLRGPQGTLFGRNTVGGAINIVSAQPSEEIEGFVEGAYGTDTLREVKAMVNAPVTDWLSLRAAGELKQQDGYASRIITGEEQGVIDRQMVRLSALARPSDDIEILAAFDWTETDETALAQSMIDVDPTQPGAPLGLYNAFVPPRLGLPPLTDDFVTGDPYRSFGTGPNVSTVDNWGVTLTASWQTDFAELKSITGYRDLETTYSREFETSPLPYASAISDQEQDQFSQELQVIGTALEDRLTYIVGGYYFTEEARDLTRADLLVGIFEAFEALPGPVPGLPFGGPGNPANLDIARIEDSFVETDSWAIFGEVGFDITDMLTVTLGGRYTQEDKTYEFMRTLPASGRVPIPMTRVSEEFSKFTPKVGVEYDLQDDILLYASYTEGYKSGGFNGRPSSTDGIQPFDEEEVKTYELGAKAQFLDDRLRTNLALFWNDYTDLQISVNRPVGAGFEFIIENAAAATIRGFELEVTAVPVDRLTLQAGIGYTDAEYDEVDASATFDESAELQEVPEWSINLGAQYVWQLPRQLELTTRADYAWKSEVYHDVNNIELIKTDDLGLLNARITLASEGGPWELSVFGTNLTDEEYLTFGASGVGVVTGTYARDRVIGVSASWTY